LDGALEKYEAAFAADPTNPVFLTNAAAVLHAKRDYDGSIAKCRQALELAREVKLRDYSFNAKAWLRIGNGYLLKKDYEQAIAAYDESLLEDGTDQARNQKNKAEKRLKKKREQDYLNPELALEAKALGNRLYGEGKYPQAVEAYTDAIKRDPTNHVFYSNRANCLAKLMSWSAALDDCETVIKMKPDFVKIYIRKGKIQHFLKQYHKAITTFDIGLALDPQSSELIQSKRATLMKIQEGNQSGQVDPERVKEAQRDPEIQAILRDPTVNNVLQAMQTDPATAQRAMRDPVISAKINKLVQAGVLAVR
jgi:stress-induced-phosphoprotein 1